LHNWVDEEYFNQIDKKLFKNTYKLDAYVLCVGHIEPRKNHLSLIKWFLKYREENQSNLKLVLFGDFRWNYFDYHKEVQDLLNDNKTEIIHINNLSSTDELFKSAYLWSKAHFLLSSLETPWLSNIESWLAWTPLILWDCKPVREYFKNYAQYIDWRNINQIMLTLKNIDEMGWYIDREKQIQFIKDSYTWEALTKDLLIHYQAIWKKK
jgi:glycosyltransferase involved in cell wall biosynthesis